VNDTFNPSDSSRDTRTTIVRVMTFLGGIYFFLYFITPESLLERVGISSAHESISNGFITIGAMAIGLGIVNIVLAHGSKVLFRKQGWGSSVTLLTGLTLMLVVTCAQWMRERAVSSDIRRLQVIGDFTSRIIEDAKQPAGQFKSFSRSGQLPPLSQRVLALERYAEEELSRVAAERERNSTTQEPSVALTSILGEVAQGESALRDGVLALSRQNWDSLLPEGEAALQSVSASAARFASAYSLMKRASGATSLVNKIYEFLYNGLFNQLGAAMFALLGVYIAAAAYRAFRIQSLESALMMTAALIVMLGQISFGKVLYHDMPALRQWLLEVPNSAAFRAIRLGAGVAGLMLAIRMWLSIESDASSTRRKRQ
jgi:hypothetical protein